MFTQRSGAGYRFSTLCATVDNPDSDHKDQHGSSSVPIYQTATFKGLDGTYDYTRSGNPTRTFLEHHMAKISSAKHAFAVTSGMGALDIICRTLKPGDEIIAGNDLYGGSNRLLTYLKQHGGIITHHLDTTNIESVRPLIVEGSPVRMVLLESPTNPLLQIVDIEKISQEIKKVIPQALVVVDNTMMSSYLMRPLEFGADIVYDSGTKYLSGHHDLMAGLVVCNSDQIAQQLGFVINSIGNGLAPFDSFLLLRGVKTLAIRMDRQQASAIRVAKYLDQLGFKVNYPGLKNHRGKEVHDRLAKGPGAVLSFETGDKLLSQKIVSSARLWGISVSFGCVNSLISMPCLMSHASIDPAVRAARNLPEDLIRLCVGIEDSDDLLEDLESALVQAGAIRIVDETAVGGYFERMMPTSSGSPSLSQSPKTSNEQISPAQAANETSKMQSNPTSLLVSAPGKIILFGEHAVVFGKKALAAAVDLRCYCLVEPVEAGGSDGTVTLSLPASDFSTTWDLNDLPWALVQETKPGGEVVIDSELSRSTFTLACDRSEKNSLVQACHAFLYLFMTLATSKKRRSQIFTLRSALPIGAGLGSSASYSVCLVASLLYTHLHLVVPTTDEIRKENVKIINRWAFLGEKILHGNPSGVDNTVSSFGGAICFKKRNDINEKEGDLMESINGFESMRILISNTQVPRDTKSLVASVVKRKAEEPDYVQQIIDEIEGITLSARELLMKQEEIDSVTWAQKMGELIESNHTRLGSLGVSHEKLETVRKLSNRFGLKAKLTGAGGGGCAITLLPKGIDDEKVIELKKEIEKDGMKTYECQVGVRGVGIMVLGSNGEIENVGSVLDRFVKVELGCLDEKGLNLLGKGKESLDARGGINEWIF
ncbi:Cys/Met metabolism PLP-dependent enzyme-domain-containing protein [Phakopsora pachyrhizi]|nr:Cys/Met metabolism PLP-dependent enzyme-domain-containing protein [Phakopsora pachyrhizi]